ncbi:MAG: Hsp33 family molecular chaperone HslO [Firmicutes bacterium]|nr:Hsp33 family molecular chaperone HslO [Bacillota bacterium]
MQDYIIRALDEDKCIRVFIASTTNLVEKARKIHNTTPTTTAALGRVLTSASLMGIMLKGDNDKLTLQFRGNGPVRSILAVANNNVNVKGYISDPNVDLPIRDDGKLDVGGAVGNNGKVIVIRDYGLKEPYVGQSNLVNGEIGEDLTQYFAASEQQPSAVSLGVLIDKDLSVKASGGFIVQVLPNIPEDKLTKLEKTISEISSISKYIDDGYKPEDILREVFSDFNMKVTDTQKVNFSCDCSKERMKEALISLGEKEIKEIIQQDEKAELVCHFCNTKYNFKKGELQELIKNMKE